MPDHRLGDLSMLYETGFRPGQEAAACAVVSTGLIGHVRADPGGKSYGAYQLSSTVQGGQQVLAFLKADGRAWAPSFAGTDPTRAGRFEAAWKVIAAAHAATFFAAQHDFIQRTHFAVVVAKVRLLTRVDLSRRCAAVTDVIWSMAVQHGPNGLFVYVVKPDSTVAVQAVTVAQDDGQVAVLSGGGIDEGTQVVTNGQSRLQNGTKVSVKPAQAT